MTDAERSISRGREGFQSTGRGGLGNIRQASASRDRPAPGTGPDDFSVTRGREPIANPNQIYSTGRGGAGNLRSPSRDPKPRAEIEQAEKDVIREYAAAHEGAVYSSGRGGIGNMNRSRSRDPSATNTTTNPSSHTTHSSVKHSTGRGGAGNILSGDGHHADSIDEAERRGHAHSQEGLHSTGRGGAANITSTPEPAVEHHAHPHHQHGEGDAHTPEYESTGRGGLGNIVRERS
ncbi:hypothetical protein GALMADRAFT_254096 [Galerina marginata CBS 339.88]|uniref:Uncharacterized protein n=1 Tax=Galerina marginata (strain CBS 339.88) TaxID=685588 RepID=A0A067SK18_GALM3|nr:hypothetical protein GALMADRAFT_254096 [Galerina marginata CBS 339.88]